MMWVGSTESPQVGGEVIYTVNAFALFYKQGPNVSYIEMLG
jgi:hypothetical protein